MPRPEPAGGDAADGPLKQRWLVLVYRFPAEQAGRRAAVGRKLKTLGAIYLQAGVAALPASLEAERVLRKLRHDIVGMAGSAMLLACEALAGEQQLLGAFLAARDREYQEVSNKCVDFLAQVEKEHHEQRYSFAELEENEDELAKLEKWFSKIAERDVFGATEGRNAAEEALRECASAMDVYAALVDEKEAGHEPPGGDA